MHESRWSKEEMTAIIYVGRSAVPELLSIERDLIRRSTFRAISMSMELHPSRSQMSQVIENFGIAQLAVDELHRQLSRHFICFSELTLNCEANTMIDWSANKKITWRNREL